MSRRAAGNGLFTALIALALLLEGVVAVLPHDHHQGAVHASTIGGIHRCTDTVPELLAVDHLVTPTTCLACATDAPILGRPSSAPDLDNDLLRATDAPADRTPASRALRWHARLRGPPHLA